MKLVNWTIFWILMTVTTIGGLILAMEIVVILHSAFLPIEQGFYVWILLCITFGVAIFVGGLKTIQLVQGKFTQTSGILNS